jgi:hypothetical protein
MPGLQSFCISSAVAMAAIFVLQVSWFVAFLALDEKRIEEKRNGFMPCISHKNWVASEWSQKPWTRFVMAKAAQIYKFKIVQVQKFDSTPGSGH